MYFKDRVPTYPNRKRIVFEDDNSFRYARIEYADDPIENGTPINALTLDNVVPNGVILMWSGSSTNIPDGWLLCDGSNGTPDLRGRFIIGSNDDYEVNSVGGQTTIDFSHKHSYSGTTNQTAMTETVRNGDDFNEDFPATYHTHTYSGNTEYAGDTEQNILPPYYALCYIMKVTQISN